MRGKINFFLHHPFQTSSPSLTPSPLLALAAPSVSLFTFIRYLQTVLLMKILELPTPRESDAFFRTVRPIRCFASPSFAGSGKDLRNLGCYFLFVFIHF